MLVFTRKVGESIVIGDDVAVTVVRIGQTDVRIGVEAPQETPIARDDMAQSTSEKPDLKVAAPRLNRHSAK